VGKGGGGREKNLLKVEKVSLIIKKKKKKKCMGIKKKERGLKSWEINSYLRAGQEGKPAEKKGGEL